MLWSELKDRFLRALLTGRGDRVWKAPAEGESFTPPKRSNKEGERKAHYDRAKDILEMFQRLVDPQEFAGVDQDLLDEYFEKRAQQRGRKFNEEGQPLCLSAATLNGDSRYLRAIINFAIARYKKSKLGIDDDWLMPVFPRFREEEKQPKALSQEQISRFLDACEHAQLPRLDACSPPEFWQALFLVAYSTGCRCKALLMLKRPDDEALAIGLINVDAKADKSGRERVRQLISPAIEAIRRMKIGPGERLFAWPFDRVYFYTTLHKLQDKAGIPRGEHALPHDMRRTFATNLVKNGTALPAVKNLMGHRDIKTTMEYVGGLSVEEIQAVKDLPQPKLGERKTPQLQFAFEDEIK